MNLETDENNGDCEFASEAQLDTCTSDDFDNTLFDQFRIFYHCGYSGKIDFSVCVELSAIVDSCCHAELVYLHQTIEPLLKRDFVCQLPLELSLQILSYLSLGDILRCAKVSRTYLRRT
ncbi:hypothetical protein AHF37_10916 [Paragonimus kellicotti]|nr:hypothetical protein AHF37_10916 [Paragonimus kellicotti]